jgi:response regulator RpfG family c-di-GMP phosphodiesterase
MLLYILRDEPLENEKLRVRLSSLGVQSKFFSDRSSFTMSILEDSPSGIMIDGDLRYNEGVEALKRIKGIKECSNLPCLVLSGLRDSLFEKNLLLLGAAYVVSPEVPVVWIKRVFTSLIESK